MTNPVNAAIMVIPIMGSSSSGSGDGGVAASIDSLGISPSNIGSSLPGTVTLTRDGFTMLVMGFTGPKAAFWRERYIQAFNLMEAELRKKAIIHAEARGRSKTIRVAATDSYKDHGATEWFHYTNNTDAIYGIVYGGTAAQLR